MRKLNRKGFTLIELLAVIVILAIIMVVTIPAILTRIGNSKQSMLDSSANTVAKWMEDQYSLAQFGTDGVGGNVADTVFTGLCGANGTGCNTSTSITAEALKAAGVDSSNYVIGTNGTGSTVVINASGRACVTLKGAGDFDKLTDATSTGC